MENNLDTHQRFKNQTTSFIKRNKKKLIYMLLILIISVFLILYFFYQNEKKNNLISEKFIQAGLYLSSDNVSDAKNIYDEIINSGNVFYSTLALNVLIEKNLEKNEKLILKYFKTIEDMSQSDDKRDLLVFKKALYLMKNSNTKEAELIFKDLINKNSKFKSLAEKIISK